MGRSLVIVESPAKAKTINKYLGRNYTVKASYGHIMDLPKKVMGIDIAHGFEPTYEVNPDKTHVVQQLQNLADVGNEEKFVNVKKDEYDPVRTDLYDPVVQNLEKHALPEGVNMNPIRAMHSVTKPSERSNGWVRPSRTSGPVTGYLCRASRLVGRVDSVARAGSGSASAVAAGSSAMRSTGLRLNSSECPLPTTPPTLRRPA